MRTAGSTTVRHLMGAFAHHKWALPPMPARGRCAIFIHHQGQEDASAVTPPLSRGHLDGRIHEERRRQPRRYQPLPIALLAATADLALFACGTWLDNRSAGGIYVRLPWPPVPGSPFIACLSAVARPERLARRVAIGGEVLRVESRLHNRYGTALRITWHYVI
jgi:hypothetical protein